MSKIKSPTEVYHAFREGMLADTEDWKELIADEATIVGPLVQLKGKRGFINIHEAFFQSVERSIIHKLVECKDIVITQISTTIETPQKKTVTLDMNEWYTIKNGKIEALVVYFDTAVLNEDHKALFSDANATAE
jgi:hypothetical protein